MAIAFVQSAVGTISSSLTGTCVFASNVTPGNLIVVGIASTRTDPVVSSITDGNGSSFTAINHINPNFSMWTYYLPNSTGGSLGKTITITFTGHTANGKIIAHEISGAAISPLDGSQHSIIDQTGVTVPTANGIISATITTSAADYIFAMTVSGFAVGNNVFTAGTSPIAYTAAGNTTGAPLQTCAEYFVQSASGSIAATWGVNNKDTEFYNAIAAFKPTATTVVDKNLLMTMGCGA